MEIRATIEKIHYEPFLIEPLQSFSLTKFNINDAPTACLVKVGKTTFAISKWVSPKRTRSYPYERVYNTLGISKKMTVIPIIKDEGQAGDRDYLQWDTVSLMSLLDVFVIFAYYNKADAMSNKITNQQFDNEYIINKIKEIKNCHSSALHWNLHELKTNFDQLLSKVKTSYLQIASQTGVTLHDLSGINSFSKKIGKDISQFKSFSRSKAEQAQRREVMTVQPKELLTTATKAKITITNYLGGEYFFTVDEVQKREEVLYLVESKHSRKSLLPSKSDVKDGLLKLILYANFATISVENHFFTAIPTLKLTSPLLKGAINSNKEEKEIIAFAKENELSVKQIFFIKILFQEAIVNHFLVIIEQAK